MQYKQIITEDLAEELREMSNRDTKDSWRLGAIANTLFYRASMNGEEMTMNFVCCAVAHYRNCSASRVQQCAKVEALFPPQDREKYKDLPFSHFEFAANFIDPFMVLDYSLDHAPISKTMLEQQFAQKHYDEQEEEITREKQSQVVLASLDPFTRGPNQIQIISGMIEGLLDMIRSGFFEKCAPTNGEIVRSELLNVISSLQKIRETLKEEDVMKEKA